MKAYELKQGWRAAILALAVVLAACGSDDQQNNGAAGGVGAPGVAINGAGVSNCTTPYGQPGVLTNSGYQQVCMPNGANCANPLYNNYGGNSVMMCPCSGLGSGTTTGGVIVTSPSTGGYPGYGSGYGSGSCGGYSPVWINSQYYYYVTPNAVNPSAYPSGGSYGYQRYYWTGRAWVWM